MSDGGGGGDSGGGGGGDCGGDGGGGGGGFSSFGDAGQDILSHDVEAGGGEIFYNSAAQVFGAGRSNRGRRGKTVFIVMPGRRRARRQEVGRPITGRSADACQCFSLIGLILLIVIIGLIVYLVILFT